MRKLRKFLSLIGLLYIGAWIGCSAADALSSPSESEAKVLNIYNWVDYISPQVIALFEQETGIKIHYDVYDNNETLEAKILTGNAAYDLVFPTAWPYLFRQIKAGAYQKIDVTKLKNYANLEPQLLSWLEDVDPGNQYAIPYLWGTAGFGYNVSKIKSLLPDAPVDSLRMLFDPEVVKHFSGCGVSLLDEAVDVIPLALAYLGLDPNSDSLEDLHKAEEVLRKVRPYITRFNVYRSLNDLAYGEMCLVQGWSGEITKTRDLAREVNRGVEIRYVIPPEGAGLWIDVMAIPKTAQHPQNALRFIDFLLRPDISGQNTEALATANSNKASMSYIREAIKNDKAIYPPKEVIKKLYVAKKMSDDYERTRNRIWVRIKSGR